MQQNQKINSNYFLFSHKNRNGSRDFHIEIDFSPQFNDELGQFFDIVPVFNNDNNPSLPGFILRIDQVEILKNYHRQKELDQLLVQKIQDAEKKIKILIEQKPRENNCQLCKEVFTDYKSHIASLKHQNKFISNRAFKKIQQIASDFQSQKKLKSTGYKIFLYVNVFFSDIDSNQTTTLSKRFFSGLGDEYDSFDFEGSVPQKKQNAQKINELKIEFDWQSYKQEKNDGYKAFCLNDFFLNEEPGF